MKKRKRLDSNQTAGIDVSSYQGVIDWTKVAARYKFAFIKATEGAHFIDAQFSRNWQQSRQKGVVRGAYHFFRPQTDAGVQAQNFISTVGALKTGDLPPVLDLEVPSDWEPIAQSKRVGLILTWCNAVEKALGVKPILYFSPSFITDVIGTENAEALKDYPLWIANYTTGSPTIPAPWTEWMFWQFSDKGTVSGVDGEVDMDWYNGMFAMLKKATKKRKRSKRKSKKNGKRHGRKNR